MRRDDETLSEESSGADEEDDMRSTRLHKTTGGRKSRGAFPVCRDWVREGWERLQRSVLPSCLVSVLRCDAVSPGSRRSFMLIAHPAAFDHQTS